MPRFVEDRARLIEFVRPIIGIEIPITKLTGKWKVSQNRQPDDRAGTAIRLGAFGGDAANEMSVLIRKSIG